MTTRPEMPTGEGSEKASFMMPDLEDNQPEWFGPEATKPAPDQTMDGPSPGQPEKKRGRARKAKEPPPPKREPTPQEREKAAKAFGMGFRAVFAAVARQRGDHWSLSAEESYSMGAAWSEALEPYMGYVAKAMPWVGAVLVTYEVIDARMAQDKLNAAARVEVIDPQREAAARPTMEIL